MKSKRAHSNLHKVIIRGTQRQFSENICSEDDFDLEFSEHLL